MFDGIEAPVFAVIRTGGKQYKVAADDRIVVEKLPGEPGAQVELGDVLMVGGDGETPTVGTPMVSDARVLAEVVEQTRGPKIIVFKKQRRKNHRRKKGHRQDLTVLRITEVSHGGKASKAAAPAPKKAAPEDAPAAADATESTEAPTETEE